MKCLHWCKLIHTQDQTCDVSDRSGHTLTPSWWPEDWQSPLSYCTSTWDPHCTLNIALQTLHITNTVHQPGIHTANTVHTTNIAHYKHCILQTLHSKNTTTWAAHAYYRHHTFHALHSAVNTAHCTMSWTLHTAQWAAHCTPNWKDCRLHRKLITALGWQNALI